MHILAAADGHPTFINIKKKFMIDDVSLIPNICIVPTTFGPIAHKYFVFIFGFLLNVSKFLYICFYQNRKTVGKTGKNKGCKLASSFPF